MRRSAGPDGVIDEWTSLVIRLLATETLALYSAQPFFVPGELAITIADSVPPPPAVIEELRLPFPAVWVVFGHDLDLPEGMQWQDGVENVLEITDPEHPLHGVTRGIFMRDIHQALYERGGAITGVVVFAGEDGVGLADHVLWIVSARPDPDVPELFRNDCQRGGIISFRSESFLRPVIDNFAAAVAGAQWREGPREAPSIGERGSERWIRSLAARSRTTSAPRRGVHGCAGHRPRVDPARVDPSTRR